MEAVVCSMQKIKQKKESWFYSEEFLVSLLWRISNLIWFVDVYPWLPGDSYKQHYM